MDAANGTSIGASGYASDSCGGVLPELISTSSGKTAKDIHDTLTSQQVEIVLTAHPTKVNRRALLDRHRRIQYLLTEADELRSNFKGNPTKFQQELLDDALEREI